MSAITQLCPYCDIRPRNSSDQIFPEFLEVEQQSEPMTQKLFLLVLPIALDFLCAPAAASVCRQRKISVCTGK
jgi:hypothetical protein